MLKITKWTFVFPHALKERHIYAIIDITIHRLPDKHEDEKGPVIEAIAINKNNNINKKINKYK